MSSDTNIKRPNGSITLNRRVLIPVTAVSAVVLLLVPLTWNVAVEWQRRGSIISRAVEDVKEVRLSLKVMDLQLYYFRLDVERKLGPMPDFHGTKPSGASDASIPRRRIHRSLQTNQVLGEPGREDSVSAGDSSYGTFGTQ